MVASCRYATVCQKWSDSDTVLGPGIEVIKEFKMIPALGELTAQFLSMLIQKKLSFVFVFSFYIPLFSVGLYLSYSRLTSRSFPKSLFVISFPNVCGTLFYTNVFFLSIIPKGTFGILILLPRTFFILTMSVALVCSFYILIEWIKKIFSQRVPKSDLSSMQLETKFHALLIFFFWLL